MAKLPDDARVRGWALWMQKNDEPGSATKPQCRLLADAADDFIDDNSGVYNTTIPVAVRGLFTARQKALALVIQLNERFRLGL